MSVSSFCIRSDEPCSFFVGQMDMVGYSDGPSVSAIHAIIVETGSSSLSSDFRSSGSVTESHKKITISWCNIIAALLEPPAAQYQVSKLQMENYTDEICLWNESLVLKQCDLDEEHRP